MHHTQSVIAMRTTINLDDALLEQAQALSGVQERFALLREAVTAPSNAKRTPTGPTGRQPTRSEPCSPTPRTRQVMILLDTSVWMITGGMAMPRWLRSCNPAWHYAPFVIGELACGNLKSRAKYWPAGRPASGTTGP